MKIIIMKKGIVDCTSDSRSYDMETLKDGIDAAIKIFEEEVLELDYATFHIKSNNRLMECQINNEIDVADKRTCLKLLNHLKNNPDQLSEDLDEKIHIHVKVWRFFNDGDNCSDYINVNTNMLEVSCQDYYDEDDRLEFHGRIEELIGSDYAVAKIDNKDNENESLNESLISLHISVTEKCSANCENCYVNKGLQRELEREDWVKLPVAEQYAIGGGEPAEYLLISELVDYLKNERKGYVAVTTNGQKIIDFNLSRSKPDKIAVSIDGLTQEEHELTHNTNLEKAKEAAEFYKTLSGSNAKVCINHILHRKNIDNAEKFAKIWIDKGYEVNFILFTGDDKLKPTYEQLDKFKKYFIEVNDKRIMIDSCMGGLFNILGDGKLYPCLQGLFSKYYRFGSIAPCSHSALQFPQCKVIEEYMIYFFKTLRPIIFMYDKDGTSGAHEWAFKAGYRGKIKHNVDIPLKKDLYILTWDDAQTIKEPHYNVFFKNKMPNWLYFENPNPKWERR